MYVCMYIYIYMWGSSLCVPPWRTWSPQYGFMRASSLEPTYCGPRKLQTHTICRITNLLLPERHFNVQQNANLATQFGRTSRIVWWRPWSRKMGMVQLKVPSPSSPWVLPQGLVMMGNVVCKCLWSGLSLPERYVEDWDLQCLSPCGAAASRAQAQLPATRNPRSRCPVRCPSTQLRSCTQCCSCRSRKRKVRVTPWCFFNGIHFSSDAGRVYEADWSTLDTCG